MLVQPCSLNDLLQLLKTSLAAVVQNYDTDVGRENVLLNNDVLFQCNIPSFISDFVTVLAWVDSEGSSYSAGRNTFGNCRVQKLDPA